MNSLNLSVSFKAKENKNSGPNESLVRNLFGLAPRTEAQTLIENFQFTPQGITYITGFSGSGKSSLLNEIKKEYPQAHLQENITIPNLEVINCFEGKVQDIIQWVSRFGLGEAGVLVTNAQELSEGQKERLKLSLLLWNRPKVIIIDEFLSKLDRLTARIIAYQIQKIIRDHRITAFFATAHHDLGDALLCDQIIELDFLGEVVLKEPQWSRSKLPESEELKVSAGSIEDFYSLKRFHYMDRQVADQLIKETATAVAKVTYKGRTIGARVYSKPYPQAFEKIKVFELINKSISVSSRVVVHPSFRGIGVSKLLSFEPDGVRPIVCTHSALEHYFPFDLATGFETREHPSSIKTLNHHELESLLKNLGVGKIEYLNEFKLAQSFFDTLKQAQQSKVRDLVAQILADYDFRLVLYYLNILSIKVNDATKTSLQQFFIKQCESISLEETPSLLTEALFFSMQGLVKKQAKTSCPE